MRKIKIAWVLMALFAMALLVRHPTADIRILAHQPSDTDPRRVEAAIDTGLLAASVLVTWTAERTLR